MAQDQQTPIETRYNSKTNRAMLFALAAHIPIAAIVAWWFDTSPGLALALGSAIFAGPALLYTMARSSRLTSVALGVGFMAFSALLIHHALGMIEMHFHIFVFIAAMIIFANPVVILAAAATIAVHHVGFFFFLPKSVFNYNATFGIVVVHAVFVVIETIPAMLISNSFRRFIISQGGIVEDLQTTASSVLKESQRSSSAGEAVATHASEQTRVLNDARSRLAQVSELLNVAEGRLAKSKEFADSSQRSAEEGRQLSASMMNAVEKIEQSYRELINQVENSNSNMSQIMKMIQDINEKTRVINDIVFQTKLLSFNASVEAARAGEAGKGFAVVAEEVGNLAQMSGNAAREITSLLETSTAQVESTVNAANDKIQSILGSSQATLNEGQSMAEKCGVALEEISRQVGEFATMVSEINRLSHEQRESLNTIESAVASLEQANEKNLESATQARESAQALSSQADDLSHIVVELVKSTKAA